MLGRPLGHYAAIKTDEAQRGALTRARRSGLLCEQSVSGDRGHGIPSSLKKGNCKIIHLNTHAFPYICKRVKKRRCQVWATLPLWVAWVAEAGRDSPFLSSSVFLGAEACGAFVIDNTMKAAGITAKNQGQGWGGGPQEGLGGS